MQRKSLERKRKKVVSEEKLIQEKNLKVQLENDKDVFWLDYIKQDSEEYDENNDEKAGTCFKCGSFTGWLYCMFK